MMNKDNRNDKIRKIAKKGLTFSLCAVLAGGLAAGSFEGVNKLAGWSGATTVEAASNKDETTLTYAKSEKKDADASDSKSDTGKDTGSTAKGSLDVSEIVSEALPSIVSITTKSVQEVQNYFGMYGMYGYAPQQQEQEVEGSGSGIIVGKNDTELLIVTNAHVVDNVSNLKCVFVDDQSVSATVKGSKSDQDIAVVAVSLSDIPSDTISKIAIAELADSDTIAVGQQVVAIGNALGEGQSVTNGIISALDRSITVNNVTFSGLIMTNAAINSGNSGGALLNASGKVIAINFAKTSSDGVEGMAYSIPVSNVKELISSLMSKQTRQKVDSDNAGYLGIVAIDITSTYASMYGYPQGIMVRTVASGSAAEKAGLSAYDIIVGFDDQSISTMSGLQSLLQYYSAGETVKVDYYHLEGSEYVLKSVEVTLGKKN